MKTIEQSIEALLKQIESGELDSLNAKIIQHAMSVKAFNKEQLMLRTGKPHQSVTAQLSWLQDIGVIEPVTKILVRGYNQTMYRYVPDGDRRIQLARTRKKDKFLRIMKRLKREFPEYMDHVQYKLPI